MAIIVILALVAVAVVIAGAMWLSWWDGYHKGYSDRDDLMRAVLLDRLEADPPDPYALRTLDGGHNER